MRMLDSHKRSRASATPAVRVIYFYLCVQLGPSRIESAFTQAFGGLQSSPPCAQIVHLNIWYSISSKPKPTPKIVVECRFQTEFQNTLFLFKCLNLHRKTEGTR